MHDHLQAVRHAAEIDAGKQHNVHRRDTLPRGERIHVEFVNLQHERNLYETATTKMRGIAGAVVIGSGEKMCEKPRQINT